MVLVSPLVSFLIVAACSHLQSIDSQYVGLVGKLCRDTVQKGIPAIWTPWMWKE